MNSLSVYDSLVVIILRLGTERYNENFIDYCKCKRAV